MIMIRIRYWFFYSFFYIRMLGTTIWRVSNNSWNSVNLKLDGFCNVFVCRNFSVQYYQKCSQEKNNTVSPNLNKRKFRYFDFFISNIVVFVEIRRFLSRDRIVLTFFRSKYKMTIVTCIGYCRDVSDYIFN